MSLKINVIYKGIIYRVKGIKVLCSVVLAVIILLVAIVGMGVWMLINVYDNDKPNTLPAVDSIQKNNTDSSKKSQNYAPYIDFGSSDSTVPSNILMHDIRKENKDKDTGNKNLRLDTVSPSYYENSDLPAQDMYDKEAKKIAIVLRHPVRKFYGDERMEPKEVTSIESKNIDSDHGIREIKTPPTSFNHPKIIPSIIEEPNNDYEKLSPKNYNDYEELSPVDYEKLSPIDYEELSRRNSNDHEKISPIDYEELSRRNSNDHEKLSSRNPNDYEELSSSNSNDYFSERANERMEGFRPIVPSQLDEVNKEEEFRANLRTLTRIPITTTTKITRRHGTPSDDSLMYVGPPVVGYGTNPYEKLTRDRIKEYDNFWRTYSGNGSTNKSRLFLGDSPKDSMKPHLRGLRPTGAQYDLPVRPDAQSPLKVKLPKIPPPPRVPDSTARPYSGDQAYPSQPRRPHSPPNDINRKLRVENNNQTNSLLKSPKGPSILTSNPLQGLYDYSKKLAASLLSFNSKSPDQIQGSSEKLAEYGINLIESHNQVFKQPSSGPLSKIVSLIPTADKLKSLDPFELSLLTWTFLDFWEFLIEKVGTLSDEDLHLLQLRLERLRKRKDDTMTRVFVNETLNRYAPNKQRSLDGHETNSEYAQMLSKDQEIKNKNNEESLSLSNNTSTKDITPSMEEHILSDLFPNFENPKEETDPKMETGSYPDIQMLLFNSTRSKLLDLLDLARFNETSIPEEDSSSMTEEGRSMWDPLGLFSSEGRMQFMQFAVKVLFNFGKVYLKKPYALDCSMLLFCKDLNQKTRRGGMEAMAAKLKSVGLKVLTESEQQLREEDTFTEVWRSVTAWTPLQCDVMFPRCDGPKALEIVNEVALGSS